MSVSAKFYVQQLTRFSYNPAAMQVKMQPVTRGEENKAWAASTPIGSIELHIINEAASSQFEIGKEYLITFEKA